MWIKKFFCKLHFLLFISKKQNISDIACLSINNLTYSFTLVKWIFSNTEGITEKYYFEKIALIYDLKYVICHHSQSTNDINYY